MFLSEYKILPLVSQPKQLLNTQPTGQEKKTATSIFLLFSKIPDTKLQEMIIQVCDLDYIKKNKNIFALAKVKVNPENTHRLL